MATRRTEKRQQAKSDTPASPAPLLALAALLGRASAREWHAADTDADMDADTGPERSFGGLTRDGQNR